MTVIAQEAMQNLLLRALSAEAFAVLAPSLEPILLGKGFVCAVAGDSVQWAVFPETGLVSIVGRMEDARQIELGVFGHEGMGAVAIVLGSDRTPNEAFVQIAGHGHRLEAGALQRALASNAELRTVLLRYVQAFITQLSQTALSNGRHTIEKRLARWLLLVHDRIEGNELALTHEFLAIMLGVRRTGVTLAIHILEGARLIRARRGVITIVDRAGLKQLAGVCYGLAEAEYERLIGPTH